MRHHNRRGSGCAPFPQPADDDSSAYFSRAHRQNRRAQHKTQQLCRQAFRALSSALAGECADPLLQNLVVRDVLPAPDARRLVVEIYLAPGSETMPLVEVIERLQRAAGLLRHAVATAIVRKRAPELVFRVVPADQAAKEDAQ